MLPCWEVQTTGVSGFLLTAAAAERYCTINSEARRNFLIRGLLYVSSSQTGKWALKTPFSIKKSQACTLFRGKVMYDRNVFKNSLISNTGIKSCFWNVLQHLISLQETNRPGCNMIGETDINFLFLR